MNHPATPRERIWNGLVWSAFAAGLILATSPVWGRLAFGFNPSLDELLQIMCVAPR